MKTTHLAGMVIVAILGSAQSYVGGATNLASGTDGTKPPSPMNALADVLAGTWSITWHAQDGGVVGEGEESWRFAPGESALIEENRSRLRGASTDDYAAIWWDSKSHTMRGIWCDPTINDEGCSGFVVASEGNQIVLTGEWEYQGTRQAWREVFRRAGATMTQTLHVGDPGSELKAVSLIRGQLMTENVENGRSQEGLELTKLATDAGHAYAARDLITLRQVTADDYVQTDVRGQVLNKDQWLAFVKNRASELSVETDTVQVRFYGETAVVSGHWTYTRKQDGKISHSQWTSVWTRDPSGWKRHAFQNTYINPDADRCATGACP
jgi:ketosteroid isomerase-like protein